MCEDRHVLGDAGVGHLGLAGAAALDNLPQLWVELHAEVDRYPGPQAGHARDFTQHVDLGLVHGPAGAVLAPQSRHRVLQHAPELCAARPPQRPRPHDREQWLRGVERGRRAVPCVFREMRGLPCSTSRSSSSAADPDSLPLGAFLRDRSMPKSTARDRRGRAERGLGKWARLALALQGTPGRRPAARHMAQTGFLDCTLMLDNPWVLSVAQGVKARDEAGSPSPLAQPVTVHRGCRDHGREVSGRGCWTAALFAPVLEAGIVP